MLAGMICGALICFLSGGVSLDDAPAGAPLTGAFSGCFAGFPPLVSTYTLTLCILPLVWIYLSGFGMLAPLCGSVVLFICSALACVRCGALFFGARDNAQFALYFAVFCLSEALTLTFIHSSARLARRFSQAVRKNFCRAMLLRYTLDILFYTGMIILFELPRSYAAAMLVLK